MLVDEDMLQTFRRIEARLNVLGECAKFKVWELGFRYVRIGHPARVTILCGRIWQDEVSLTFLSPTGQ
jgi:hypothetical protein